MKVALIYILRVYQAVISPVFPSVCRFDPSCSSYAIAAVQKYGVFRGSAKAVRRLSRCHPFSGKFGPDPV